MAGYDPARPIPKPVPSSAGDHGFAFSDDFTKDRMGMQWSFYKGSDEDRARYRYENGALVLKAKGASAADSSPLWFVTGDQASTAGGGNVTIAAWKSPAITTMSDMTF